MDKRFTIFEFFYDESFHDYEIVETDPVIVLIRQMIADLDKIQFGTPRMYGR